MTDQEKHGRLDLTMQHNDEYQEIPQLHNSPQGQEAIERLAGGLAQEFNNMLTIILNYSSILLQNSEPNDPRCSDLKEIKNAAERAAILTRDLLAFSQKLMLQPKIIDLNVLIGNMEMLLCNFMGENIELLLNLEDGLGKVKVDPEQIKLVIVNLVANAKDSMQNGGKLILKTKNTSLDGKCSDHFNGIESGHYVELTISDTGCGMDDKTLSRIFEPFFSTKGKGKSRGLGLSASYGIIKQSQGYIRVDSNPGCGTSFKIYLPQIRTEIA